MLLFFRKNVINFDCIKMDEKEEEDFFFIVDELEETESELRETRFKITKMESELNKRQNNIKLIVFRIEY